MSQLCGLLWWIDRWRQSSAYTNLTLAEQGAYRNLLDEAHLRGGAIPNNERILAKASGDALAWPEVRKAVLERFELMPDGWHNLTLDRVLFQSLRRARNQAAYRERKKGNNGPATNPITSRSHDDNKHDNKRPFTPKARSQADNKRANKPVSQDQDQDQDLGSGAGTGSKKARGSYKRH